MKLQGQRQPQHLSVYDRLQERNEQRRRERYEENKRVMGAEKRKKDRIDLLIMAIGTPLLLAGFYGLLVLVSILSER